MEMVCIAKDIGVWKYTIINAVDDATHIVPKGHFGTDLAENCYVLVSNLFLEGVIMDKKIVIRSIILSF